MTGRVLLVGMMGAGKTAVGEALSARTGWPYLDNDVLLERTAGLSAKAVLERDGESGLRTAESAVLTLVLGLPGPLVASIGGGVVLDERDRQRLREGGHVVWLRATTATLVTRLAGDDSRPWLGENPKAALSALAAERDPFYAEVADQVLDVDSLTARIAARRIADALPL